MLNAALQNVDYLAQDLITSTQTDGFIQIVGGTVLTQ